jgi:hypothetical protein
MLPDRIGAWGTGFRLFADLEKIERFTALFLQSKVFIAPRLSEARDLLADETGAFLLEPIKSFLSLDSSSRGPWQSNL